MPIIMYNGESEFHFYLIFTKKINEGKGH